MQPAAQVLRPRKTQTGGVRIDSGEVLGGDITDQDIRHTAMISADITVGRLETSRSVLGPGLTATTGSERLSASLSLRHSASESTGKACSLAQNSRTGVTPTMLSLLPWTGQPNGEPGDDALAQLAPVFALLEHASPQGLIRAVVANASDPNSRSMRVLGVRHRHARALIAEPRS